MPSVYDYKIISPFNFQKNIKYTVKTKKNIIKLKQEIKSLKNINEYIYSDLKKLLGKILKLD